ncbi:MAG: DUF695 domain-containing protein, partial [Cellvibrionaceae bacterium]|nr:DUF695 domain-containing protein [Cellvibrionaceae bacterium]
MNIKTAVSLILIAPAFLVAEGVEEFWWSYSANYDSGPGSIRVNLRLRGLAPIDGYEDVVVTGVTYDTERLDGMPDKAKYDQLYKLL